MADSMSAICIHVASCCINSFHVRVKWDDTATLPANGTAEGDAILFKSIPMSQASANIAIDEKFIFACWQID